MRILNVGDFNWMTGRERGTANLDLFPIREKLGRAAVRAGHLVTDFSDRATRRIHSPLGLRSLGQRACRRLFLQLVDELQPDLVLLHFADDVDTPALDEARRLSPGVTIVDINIDPLPSPRTRQRLLARRGAVDATFVTTAGEALAEFSGPNGFVAFMPNPADAAVETGRAFAEPAPAVDLLFPAGDDSPRQIGQARIRPSALLDELRADLPDLRIDSPGLGSPRLRGRAYFAAMERARMGLSLSRWSDQPLYSSDRMVHMMGSGLLTFADRRTGFDALYAPDELPTYTDAAELKRLIARNANDDALRREVAQKGWRRTFALFEVGRVFDYLLQQLFNPAGAQDFEWPTRRWNSA